MGREKSREEVIADVREAQRLLENVWQNDSTPAVSRAAYQANVYCHSILWELGEERVTHPEQYEE